MELLKLKTVPHLLFASARCPKCKSENFFAKGREAMCIACGLVIIQE